jgi:hypothetical protein
MARLVKSPVLRLPRGRLVEYTDEKAALFFLTDVSAVGAASYDSWVSSPNNMKNAFTAADLTAINTTMRARTAAKYWEAFTAGDDLPWLVALDQRWDLIEMPSEDWRASFCEDRLREALHQLDGPYRRASVMTKLLHLKRPQLVPICDSYVAKSMGVSAWDAESTLLLILAIRETGLMNLKALREISSRLASIGFERPLVRILDVLLWFDAPYEGTPGPYGLFEKWLVEHHGGRLFF